MSGGQQNRRNRTETEKESESRDQVESSRTEQVDALDGERPSLVVCHSTRRAIFNVGIQFAWVRVVQADRVPKETSQLLSSTDSYPQFDGGQRDRNRKKEDA